MPQAEPARTIGVAIAIPEPYGSELQNWREHFGDPLARSIPTHVTLLPPTQIPTEASDEVDAHLRAIAERGKSFEMLLRGTGSFRPASPVVFVTVADGISACEILETQVRSGPLGHRELDFVYHPHVTVAHDIADEALSHAFEKLTQYEARFTVEGFGLYEHGSDGVWRPVRSYSFGAAGAGAG